MKIEIHVYQYSHVVETLSPQPVSRQCDQVSRWLKNQLGKINSVNGPDPLYTMQELHVLRILRHIRESIGDMPRLKPEDFIFYFDKPDESGMVEIRASDDGDFIDRVPGNFFHQRADELF